MKKKRLLSGIICLALILTLLSGAFSIPAEAGSIVNISTVAGLKDISSTGSYQLTADIDLTGVKWSPLAAFSGTLDGNGYKISNLAITDTTETGNSKGLFASIGEGGSVYDLGIECANLTAGDNVGIIAASNAGTISRCYTTGTVSGGSNVGGLVGVNTGSIVNCYSRASVSGKDYLGGLAGSNSGTVTTSYAASTVTDSVLKNYLEFTHSGFDTVSQGYTSGGYIEIPDPDSDPDPDKNAYKDDAFTLEAWFQLDGTGLEFIISKSAPSNVEWFEIHTNGNGLRFIPIPNGNISTDANAYGGDTWIDVKNVLQDGWFHVAAVYWYDSPAKEAHAQVYVNGEAQEIWRIPSKDAVAVNVGKTATIARTTNPLADEKNSFPINIGRRGDNSYYFDGKIADVRFWNTARTAEQIKANKDKVLNGNEDGLVGYWKLNETSGNAIDSSSTKNNGKLNGTVTRTTSAAGAASKGALVGDNTGTVEKCYYDSTVYGPTYGGAGTAKSTDEMQKTVTFAEWDFANTWKIEAGSYPVFYQYAIPNATFTATGDSTGTLSNVSDKMQYSVDGGTTWTDITGASMEIAGVGTAHGVKVKQPGNGVSHLTSEVQTITVTQADTPSAPELSSRTATSITLATVTNCEYSKDGTAWQAIPTFNTGLTAGTSYTFYQRVKASGTCLASAASPQATIYTLPATPTALTLAAVKSKTNSTIVLTGTVATQQYACRAASDTTSSLTWMTGTGSDLTFAGLTENTAYNIVTRIEAAGNVPASLPSEALSVTTKSDPADVSTLTAPTISSVTASGFTMTFGVGYEWLIADNSDSPDWSKANRVESEALKTIDVDELRAATKYTIHYRIFETDNAMPSGSSTKSVYTAYATPATGEGYEIDYAAETIDIDPVYEVYTAEGSGTKIESGSITDYILAHGATRSIYIRKAESGDIPASAWLEIALAPRPATPTVPDAPERSAFTDESVTISVPAGWECLVTASETAPTGATWTGSIKNSTAAADVHTFEDLSADTTYYLHSRTAATNEAFASASGSSDIGKTKTAPVAFAATITPEVTDGSVTLTYDEAWEYKLSTEDTWLSGEGKNVFTGLDPATSYTFNIRVIGTDTAMPSETKEVTQYTAHATPTADDFNVTQPAATSGEKSKGVIVVAEGKTASDYEYRIKTGETWPEGWTNLGEIPLTAIDAPATIELRVAKNGDVPPSEAFTITIKKYVPPYSPPAATAAPVIVDGEEYNIGTVKTEDKVTTVTVDQTELQKQLDSASDNVVIPVATDKKADTVTAQLVVENVDKMAEKEMTLSVQVDDVSYDLPAVAIDTAALMQELGATDPTKVPIDVTITELSKDDVTLENGELILPPVAFTVTASYGGRGVEVQVFEKYVKRVIAVPAGVDAGKITTAVVVENGKQRHVPTEVFRKDGKWYAKINSLTNSTYALISNELSFADAEGKWFEAVVTEMASRGIINGRGASFFEGDGYVTRAEFAAILVRALGLPENGKASVFTDVGKNEWYYGAVGKAYEYGLINGRSEGAFEPTVSITRQEAMAMVRRAAAIAEFAGTTGTLDAFTDAGSVSSWALADAQWNVGSGLISGDSTGAINAKANITRGETATVVLRLLQKSGLVDARTKA